MNGGAGPLGVDAHEWRRLCTSCKGASRDLSASLATVVRRIFSSYNDPSSIRPLLAGRLNALDKHWEVHPIGIGGTALGIIAKAVLSIAPVIFRMHRAASSVVWWLNLWH